MSAAAPMPGHVRKTGTVKHMLGLAAAGLFVLALTGCVQTDMLIKVNPDGSGTLEETILMNRDAAAQLKSAFRRLGKKGDAQEAKKQGPEGQPVEPVVLWKEEEISARAATMGEGVEFQGMELLETEGYEGYRAVFSFADINKLFVNQNPGEAVPQEPEQHRGARKRELIRFKFARGKPAVLTIVQPGEPAAQEPGEGPGDEQKEEPADAGAEKTPGQLQQEAVMAEVLKMMFAGMRISLEVEVAGEIVRSNATHRQGSRVTLMALDFDRLIADAERFRRFALSRAGTIESAKALMKGLPGVKVETAEEVRIWFE